jgi:hypothetical protein
MVLPSGTDLRNTSYYTVAYAYDKAGNRLRSAETSFTVDANVSASVIVTTPTNGSSAQSLVSLAGKVSDNPGGTGIVRVDVYLRRKNSSGALEYWGLRNGVWNWATTTAELSARLSSPGAVTSDWSLSTGMPEGMVLPSGTELRAGTYYPLAYAYDRAGNRLVSDASSFKIVSAVSGRTAPKVEAIAPKSSVILSSVSAGNGGDITLAFTGALDVNSASDITRYTVKVDGIELGLQSVALRTKNSVVLGLEDGMLQDAQTAVVTYDLLDAQGKAIEGEAKATVR